MVIDENPDKMAKSNGQEDEVQFGDVRNFNAKGDVAHSRNVKATETLPG